MLLQETNKQTNVHSSLEKKKQIKHQRPIAHRAAAKMKTRVPLSIRTSLPSAGEAMRHLLLADAWRRIIMQVKNKKRKWLVFPARERNQYE